MTRVRPTRWHRALLPVLLASLPAFAGAAEEATPLRVCADPNNLPLSNSRGEGYENKIAEALARDLGRKGVEYAFFPHRMGFVRNTLRQQDPTTKQYRCDVIIGVPAGYELTATTRPYMRSTYALVYRPRADLANLATAEDLLKLPKDKLQSLRYGVFSNSPGTDWLLKNGLLSRAAVFQHQSGDPQESPALTIERELEAGRIDVAILWGPMAGQLVRRRPGADGWRAVAFSPSPEIKFDYEISMGVRYGEKEWKEQLDRWIASHASDIDAILTSYRIPLVDGNGNVKTAFRSGQ